MTDHEDIKELVTGEKEKSVSMSSQTVEKWFCAQVVDMGVKIGGQVAGIDGINLVEDFSLWFGSQVGGKNETVQSATYMLTMIAIHEIGKAVLPAGVVALGVGGGILKGGIDMTALQLHQIKETLVRIEGKIDAMMKVSLESSIDFFKSALRKIQYDDFEEAFKSFEKVDTEATRAFNTAKSKEKLSVEDFDEIATAARLLTLSKIAMVSFDKENKRFLPYLLLGEKKVKLIGAELEDIVIKCMEQKKRVQSTFFNKQKNKGKVQDNLDSVLKVAYPYISQAQGLTDFNNLVKVHEKTVTIQVKPEYIPLGEEDATEIIVGVGDTTASLLKAKVWRDEKIKNNVKIFSETDSIKVVIQSFVMSGDGEHCLGQYFYDPKHDCYKQHHTEGGLHVYIYQVGKVWYAGWEPGQTEKYVRMKNETGGETVPRTGWQYEEGDKWVEDKSIEITPGLMKPCEEVTFIGEGKVVTKHPDYLGTFTRTDEWYCGRPILMNNKGKYLYCFGDWKVCGKIGYLSDIRSSTAPLCPADIKNWCDRYNITVTCATHKKEI